LRIKPDDLQAKHPGRPIFDLIIEALLPLASDEDPQIWKARQIEQGLLEKV
jgi:hypothetical protein